MNRESLLIFDMRCFTVLIIQGWVDKPSSRDIITTIAGFRSSSQPTALRRNFIVDKKLVREIGRHLNMATTHSPVSPNLYRIVSFDRAVQMLKLNQLYFSSPSTWDDPYEVGPARDQLKNIFAQCWSRKAQSDAMWRIYSPHGVGVRIGTTRERLQKALDAVRATKGIQVKIQNVKYLLKEELDLELRSIRKMKKPKRTISGAISPLFFLKRDAFSHEKETRVVVFDQEATGDTPRKRFILPADTHELLTDIWIDPRAPQAYVDAFTLYLKIQLKFPGTVEKSSLYDACTPGA